MSVISNTKEESLISMWGNRGFFYRLVLVIICFLLIGLPFLIPLSTDKTTSDWLKYTIIGIYCGVFVLFEVGLEIYIHLRKKKKKDE